MFKNKTIYVINQNHSPQIKIKLFELNSEWNMRSDDCSCDTLRSFSSYVFHVIYLCFYYVH